MRRALPLLAALSATAVQAEERVRFDLVTRNRVEIAAPAEAIWPRLLDLPAWKDSIARIEPVAGSGRAAGDVVAVHLHGGEGAPAYFLRTLEADPARRAVWRIFDPDDPSLVGYVAAELAEQGGRTSFVWDVFAAYDLAVPPGVTAEQYRGAVLAATRAKLESDMEALRVLVEP